MKRKLLLSASFVVATVITNAQFKKGSVLLGGDVGFGKQNSSDGAVFANSNDFSFSPSVAFATKQDLFQGIRFSFSYANNEFSGQDANKSNRYGVSYFIRKYKNIFGKFSGFLQAGIGTDYSKYKSLGLVPYTSEVLNINVGLNPGITFPVHKKIFLETGFSNILSLYFQQIKREVQPNSPANAKATSFGFSSNLSAAGNGLYFGFRIMLPK